MAERADVVLLIHGTFATAKEVRGPRWWQIESDFWRHLSDRLRGRVGCQPEPWVFRWSGDNSERERQKAGRDLYAHLRRLEDKGLPYHLVAHSHGGSVIWAALRESIRRGHPLTQLRSWATVATPFLHYRARRSDALLIVPVLAFTALGLKLPEWFRLVRGNADAIWEGGRGAALTALAVVASLGLIYLAWRLLSALRAAGRAGVDRRRGRRALAHYGDRWLGVWSSSDEAINGWSAPQKLVQS